MISLSHYLVLGAVLFAISIVGIFLNRKNVIILLMAIELMLLAVNMNFVAFSHYLQDMSGQIFVFFTLRWLRQSPPLALRYSWCCSVVCTPSMWTTWTNLKGKIGGVGNRFR